jgi:hypothetical protein
MSQVINCSPQPPRCALARWIAAPPDKELIKRQGWQQNAILVIALDDPRLDMIGREFIRQIGRRLYGKESGA